MKIYSDVNNVLNKLKNDNLLYNKFFYFFIIKRIKST